MTNLDKEVLTGDPSFVELVKGRLDIQKGVVNSKNGLGIRGKDNLVSHHSSFLCLLSIERVPTYFDTLTGVPFYLLLLIWK